MVRQLGDINKEAAAAVLLQVSECQNLVGRLICGLIAPLKFWSPRWNKRASTHAYRCALRSGDFRMTVSVSFADTSGCHRVYCTTAMYH